MQLKLRQILRDLALRRPIFYNESHFQFALAWEIQRAVPEAEVRLEFPAFGDANRALDIWVRESGGSGSRVTAIEVMYIHHDLDVLAGTEHYVLANHGAPDQRRFDYAEEIQRLEQLAVAHHPCIGYSLLLTNDTSLWNPGRVSQADEFKIHQGRVLSGTLSWAPNTPAGTRQGRPESLHLRGAYGMDWCEYSEVGNVAFGRFRYLLSEVKVEPAEVRRRS